MLDRLIVFLIRLKLGVKKCQLFRFSNQKTKDLYYFTDDRLLKIEYKHPGNYIKDSTLRNSGVPLNWLLDKECKVIPWEAQK